MKKIIGLSLALCFLAGTAWAAKTTYIVTNNRFNYVKIKEVGGKEAQELGMTHPATIDEGGLRGALASINLSRSFLIKKEVDSQRVFDDTAIDYLAPALVRAFAQANQNEIIVFSYLSKNPIFILRNDRLNIADAWISNNELHVRFQKMYAKLTGDTDKRGNEAKLISQARGLRVKLELGPGQKLGVENADEIVLDLNYNYVKAPEPEKPAPIGVTMSGKKSLPGAQPGEEPAPQAPAATAAGAAAEDQAAKKKGAKAAKSKETATVAEPPPTQISPSQKTAKERLEELNQLMKDGLINKGEFETKKKDILKDL